MAGYYLRFIYGFEEISAPLHSATSKKRTFKWDEEKNETFERLKQALPTPPVLAFPYFESSFVVETDASGIALGPLLA